MCGRIMSMRQHGMVPETSIVEIVPGLGQCKTNLETNALGTMSE